jgi:elongator complex protein 3
MTDRAGRREEDGDGAWRRALRDIVREILQGGDVARVKKDVARRYGLPRMPGNPEILGAAGGRRRQLEPLLRKKPVRTLSGIAVVAVMARPYPCPGECIYCPQGEDAPKSYTGLEPAAMRAMRLGYDPFLQVRDRLTQLYQTGHSVDKAELIVMGGTFNSQPRGYRRWFLRRCLDAMNSFDDRVEESGSLEEAQRRNEMARVRNVGITLETRPDYCREEHIDEMLMLGVTRVELGVQSIKEGVYHRVKRGHTLGDVAKATQLLRDAGLKVGYHMMPGLFASPEEDLEQFRRLFSDPDYRPDFLKIYPALVLRGTGLYDLWRRGEYTPLDDGEALKLIVEIKRLLPKWVRVMRIQRDIPSQLIEAGVRKSDLGARVYSLVEGECRCIRCREAGHRMRRGVQVDWGSVEVLWESYEAASGVEHFISAEDVDHDILLGYLRLRFPSPEAHRGEVDGETALVRELRVLGRALPLGLRSGEGEQHRGLGRMLLEEAEEKARENGYRRLLVTSAIGTRDYYRGLGYARLGPYMVKLVGNR